MIGRAGLQGRSENATAKLFTVATAKLIEPASAERIAEPSAHTFQALDSWSIFLYKHGSHKDGPCNKIREAGT